MDASIGDYLRARAESGFVARQSELTRLAGAFASATAAPSIVWVHGPGGVGKTALVRIATYRMADAGARIAWVPGEYLTPSPEGFLGAIREVVPDIATLGRRPIPDVVVVDAFERIDALEHWLFDKAIPSFGPNLVVIVSSRTRLDARLRTSLGVADLLESIELDELPETAAREHLARRGVPTALHDGVLGFTGGHPLALSLAAERYAQGRSLDLAVSTDAADTIAELAQAFLRDAPTPDHAAAIEALCTVRVLDAALLDTALGRDARELFGWLRGLSFVQTDAGGLVPHALVREVIFRDVLERAPARHAAVSARLSTSVLARAVAVPFAEQPQVFLDALYARRRAGVVGSHMQLEGMRSVRVAVADPQHCEEARAIVERHEGADSAARFMAVYAAQPERLHVVTDVADRVIAVLFFVAIGRLSKSLIEGDDALEKAMQIRDTLARSPGEDVACARWWMTQRGYQDFDDAMPALMISGPYISAKDYPAIRHLLFANTPPEAWQPLAPAFHMRALEVTAERGGRHYGFAHADVAAIVAERPRDEHPLLALTLPHLESLAAIGEAKAPADVEPPAVMFSREAFGDALREALGVLHRAHELSRASIVGAAFVGQGSREARAARFVALANAAYERLCASPGYKGSTEVLRVTYFDPEPKQQAAAAALGIPFGTYRYRLRKALDVLGDELWLEEQRARASR